MVKLTTSAYYVEGITEGRNGLREAEKTGVDVKEYLVARIATLEDILNSKPGTSEYDKAFGELDFCYNQIHRLQGLVYPMR